MVVVRRAMQWLLRPSDFRTSWARNAARISVDEVPMAITRSRVSSPIATMI
jgi:hypothetical protein